MSGTGTGSLASLQFLPELPDFYNQRANKPVTVLSGANNSGKSLVLKHIKLMLGERAYMVGANRFYHVYQIGTAIRDPNALSQFEQQFRQQFYQPEYNYEQNFLDLNQILISLDDSRREEYFSLVGNLLGAEIQMLKTDPKNDLSMRYIDIDGRNLSSASSGTRLLMTLVGIFMDDRFETLLIDEPELGLSPRVQHALASFLQDEELRRKLFPHLQRVVMATHSQLFLNRSDLTSNFTVQREGNIVSINQVRDISQFHRLQFNLLGNDLEDAYLPAAIVVVEGPSDLGYIERVLQLRYPTRRITVVQSKGDPKRQVASLAEVMGGLQASPFRDRIFVVMDSKHTYSDRQTLENMGLPAQNVVIWDHNGVEYVYPHDIIAKIYSCSSDQVTDLEILEDVVSLNGIHHRKIELQKMVLALMEAETVLPVEFEQKLLQPLSQAIS